MIEIVLGKALGIKHEFRSPLSEGWWYGLDENAKAKRIMARFRLQPHDCAIYTFALGDVDDDIVTPEINAHTKSQITALHSLHHSSGQKKYVEKCPYHANTSTVA
jgi:hypothetical protein